MATTGIRCPRCNCPRIGTERTLGREFLWRGKTISSTRRKRRCEHCNHVFYSRELPEELMELELYKENPELINKQPIRQLKQLDDADLWKVVTEIGGGLNRTMDAIFEQLFGYNTSVLNNTALDKLDKKVFTCDECHWSLPLEELSGDNEEDDNICHQCYRQRLENED